MNLAAALAGSPWGAEGWQPGPAAIASPMWQAVEWDAYILPGQSVFLKLLSPDMAELVNSAAAIEGAQAAGTLGISPALLWANAAQQAMAFTLLPPAWRAARLDDLQRPAVMQKAIAAKKSLRAAPAFSRRWDVFAEITRRLVLAQASSTALPADMPSLLSAVRQAQSAIEAAGFDLAPCHNDGQASNLLLGPDEALLLCDFDCAGQADPYYDLAVLLNEAHAFEEGWLAGLEMHDGTASPALLKRCRLYGLADDLLWGLTGLLLSRTSPRHGLEFLKYGEWRLLRARMALRTPGLLDHLQKL